MKFIYNLTNRLFMMLVIILPVQLSSQSNIVFDAYFEGGNFNELQACWSNAVHGSSVSVVDNPLVNADNPTGKVVKYVINQSQERSENRIHNPGTLGEFWYGWQIYLPANWQPAIGKADIVQQWHRGGSLPTWAGGNPMEIHINDDGTYTIAWSYGGDGSRVNKHADLTNCNANDDKGKWIHWAFHVKWAKVSTGGNGFMEVYHNGELVFSDSGPNWLELDRTPCWKAGIYTGNPGWTGPSTYTIYDDNFILGNSNSSLAEVNPYLSASSDPVSGVTINNCPTLEISVGSTYAFTKTVLPTTAGNKAVSWSSSNTTVGTIDASGVFTALSQGSTTITVTTDEGGFTDICNVNVILLPVQFEDDFSGTMANWTAEIEGGNGTVTVTGGKLDIDVDDGATIWCHQKFSGNIEITYKAKYLSGTGYDIATDFNQFFMAMEQNGSDVNIGSRNGVFGSYDNLNMYYASVGGNLNSTTRFRKYYNNNKDLIYNYTSPTNTFNSDIDVRIRVEDGLVQYYYNDQKVFEYADANPYNEGYFAFRTTAGGSGVGRIHLQYDDFKVISLDADTVLVTGISIDNCQGTMGTGNTHQLTATISPSNATDKAVSWASSNTSVATVDANGLVTAIAPGNATIMVTTNDGGFIENCSITVSDIAVTGVSIDNCPGSALLINDTYNLSATLLPSDATDKSVSWSSSNTSVATVDANGLITAIAEGNATITVTTTDGNFTDNCAITINAAPSCAIGYFISNNGYEDGLTDWENLSSTIVEENSDVYCGDKAAKVTGRNSNNDGIMQYITDDVNNNGDGEYYVEAYVKTVSGTSTAKMDIVYNDGSNHWSPSVTAAINSTSWTKVSGTTTLNFSGSVSWARIQVRTTAGTDDILVDDVVVKKGGVVNVTGVSITNCLSGSLAVGATLDLIETVTPSDAIDMSVSWSSSNASVASVDGNGIVTANAAGTVTITVTTNDGSYTDNCIVTVDPVAVTGVTIDNCSVSAIEVGNTYNLNKTVSPIDATDKSIIWSSSNASVASVDANGLVTANAEGSATITVTTNDGGFTDNCVITVNPVSVTGVSIDNCPVTNLIVNDTYDLNETVSPTDAADKTVSWSTSNAAIATVNANGLITAMAVGSATITVTTNDGSFTDNCLITVDPAPISVNGVSIDNCPGSSLLIGATYDLNETVSPADADDKSVSWSSSNASVASVDASGLVIANSVGSATITVTTNDGGYTANCVITVDPIAVTGITIDNCPATDLTVNDTYNLNETVSPSNATNKSVSWSTSNASVATVDASGLVSAVAEGSATITITTTDGSFTDNCIVNIVAGAGCADGFLLSNNGFEDGLTDWSGLSCNITVESSTVFCGIQAAKTTDRNDKNDGFLQYITDEVIANGNGTYYIEAYMRTVSGSATAKMDIVYNDGSNHWSPSITASINSNSWTKVSGTTTVNYSGSLSWARAQFRTSDVTTNILIDDAVVYKSGAYRSEVTISLDNISVYPMPCSSCNINSGEEWIGASIQIMDIYGRTIYNGQIYQVNQRIEISENYTGMAILKIEKNGQTYLDKIVVE